MVSKGYYTSDNHIIFYLENNEDADSVYVVGNFMGWKEKNKDWRMDFDKKHQGWILKKKKETIKNPGLNIYEFTFIIDGEWIDVDKDSENVIHCSGYGYRYTIPKSLFDM